ncbi:hypothetical protein V8G54_019868 [Vigna mungo]|uniref:Aminotransferase-like plant mobile domain-containing protein n=1 Tax=Vigna mungo TaxID=3915 RepID=A0AAQ3NB85_VIGMU
MKCGLSKRKGWCCDTVGADREPEKSKSKCSCCARSGRDSPESVSYRFDTLLLDLSVENIFLQPMTKYLAHVNTLLTDVQKTFIQTTPFAWLLSIDTDIKMCRKLVLQLCNTWLERRGGFEVRSIFIPFTKLDVCLGLGVRVNGEMFKLFKEEVDCHTRRLFDTNDVSVDNVYEQLQNCIKGGEVADVWNTQKRSHCHVDGCIFALQIWAMEHVLFGQNKLAKTKTCIPRILHWMHVRVGEAEVEKAFSSNEVITEVYVSKEEMYIEIVKEAIDGDNNIRVKDNLHRRSIADIVAENEALRTIIVDQEVSIAKLEKEVEKLQMIHAKKRQPKVYDGRTPVKNSNSKGDYKLDEEFRGTILHKDNEIVLYSAWKSNSEKGDDVGNIDIEKDGDDLVHEEILIQNSDMYTRLKAQPRKRVKSVSLKTPWTKLDRKNRRRIE